MIVPPPKTIQAAPVGSNAFLQDTDIEKQLDLNTQLFITYLKNRNLSDQNDPQQMMNTMMAMMNSAQQLKTNKILTDQTKIHEAIYQNTQNQLVGKMVRYSGNDLAYNGGEQQISVSLPNVMDDAALCVKDRYGRLIKTIELDPNKLQQSVTFDGIDDFGQSVDHDIYHLSVQSLTNGQDIDHQTVVHLLVDCLEFTTDGAAILKCGAITLDPGRIIGIQAS
jgi:flagellar hook assembly protein FlgD